MTSLLDKLTRGDIAAPDGALGYLIANALIALQKQDGTATNATPLTILSVQPPNPAQGPFQIVQAGALFSPYWDPVTYIGYNIDHNGTQAVAGEPYAGLVFEGDYWDGTKHNIEVYFEIRSADNLVNIRPLFFHFDRGTNKVYSTSVVGDEIDFLDSAGNNKVIFQPGQFLVYPGASGDTLFYIKSLSGQSGILNLGYNGNDQHTQIYEGSGYTLLSSGNALFWFFDFNQGTSGCAAMSIGANDNNAVFSAINNAFAGTKGIVARAKSDQTASLFEAQKSDASVYWALDKVGHPLTVATAPTPTPTAGAGAGTSPTVSVSGTDVNGVLSVTTGTTPTGSNAVVGTITFGTAYAAAPKTVILAPANAAAAALSGATQVFVDSAQITTALWKLVSGSTALAASTAYKWFYQVLG